MNDFGRALAMVTIPNQTDYDDDDDSVKDVTGFVTMEMEMVIIVMMAGVFVMHVSIWALTR